MVCQQHFPELQGQVPASVRNQSCENWLDQVTVKTPYTSGLGVLTFNRGHHRWKAHKCLQQQLCFYPSSWEPTGAYINDKSCTKYISSSDWFVVKKIIFPISSTWERNWVFSCLTFYAYNGNRWKHAKHHADLSKFPVWIEHVILPLESSCSALTRS